MTKRRLYSVFSHKIEIVVAAICLFFLIAVAIENQRGYNDKCISIGGTIHSDFCEVIPHE